MSWSTSVQGVINDKEATGFAIQAPTFSDEESVKLVQDEQFAAALEAATVLLKAVGRQGDRVNVSVSGHANPDHGPRAGWADECITVSVFATPQAAAPAS